MLSSRVFWKLLAASAGIYLAAALVFGLLVSRWQADELSEQVDGRLRNAALLVADDLADQIAVGRSEALQQRVRKLGRADGHSLHADRHRTATCSPIRRRPIWRASRRCKATTTGRKLSARCRAAKGWQSTRAPRSASRIATLPRGPKSMANRSASPAHRCLAAAIDELTAAKRRLVWSATARDFSGGARRCRIG